MSTKHKSYKDVVKQLDQEYQHAVKQAEKEYSTVKQEAGKACERERAEIKAKYQKVERNAKEKYNAVKESAKEAYIQLTIDTVKNAIMAIKAEAAATHSHPPPQRPQTFASMFSAMSSSSSSSSSLAAAGTNVKKDSETKAKQDQKVRELVEFAVDRLETHLPKKEVRQRLLEEIALMAATQPCHHPVQTPSSPFAPPHAPPKSLSMTSIVPPGTAARAPHGMEAPPPSYVSAISKADQDALLGDQNKQ